MGGDDEGTGAGTGDDGSTPSLPGSMEIIVRSSPHLPTSRSGLRKARKLSAIIKKYQREHSIKRVVDLIARRKVELGFGSLAILSLNPQEGKSFFTAVLASSLAEYLSARVLVVDATGRANNIGVLSALEITYEGLSPDQSHSSNRGSCKIVTASELFGSLMPEHEFRVGEIIREAQSKYDLTLVDTQALTASGSEGFDAALVAQQLDATLAIISDKTDGSDALDSLKDRLESITAPCIGCVVNSRLM